MFYTLTFDKNLLTLLFFFFFLFNFLLLVSILLSLRFLPLSLSTRWVRSHSDNDLTSGFAIFHVLLSLRESAPRVLMLHKGAWKCEKVGDGM